MSLMADALQPFILPGLIGLGGRPDGIALPDIIVAPGAAFHLAFNAIDQSITLDFRDSQKITAAVASDVSRFASAAFQTISSIGEESLERDTLAWSLVKSYYAAFYAGHAVLRIVGESCSYFERRHTTRLNELGVVTAAPSFFKLDSGVYRCVIQDDETVLQCTRARGFVGGAHESFWALFGDRIRVIAEGVLRSRLAPSEAQSVFAQLESFREMMQRHGAYSWLSVIRNEVQYRQQHGVWFPTQVRRSERSMLSRLALQWTRDPMNIDLPTSRGDSLRDFVIGCSFAIALCRTLLDRIAERSTAERRSFLTFGPLAFLNDVQSPQVTA